MEKRLLQVANKKLKKEELSDYFTWVKAVWVNSRGKPLTFEDRHYLKQIYTDQHDNIVYTKPAQMGLSERMLSEAVWLPEQKGYNVLFTTPAQQQLQDFVQARLNPVLQFSDYLYERIESDDIKTQKLGLKKIGRGHIYFRGSQNAKQIITVDADCVYLDERDRFIEENVPYIDKRMNASDLKWRREVSTPTLPEWGVHKAYLESDRRVWEVKCEHCGTWQELDFFKNIDFKKGETICRHCNKWLNRLADGRWRVTNPDSEIHGYKIPGLVNPKNGVSEILKKYKKAQESGFSAMQQFFNQTLGLPYEVEGQQLKINELEACRRDYMFPVAPNKVTNTYLGADIGSGTPHHLVVVEKIKKDKYRIVWAGTVNSFFGPQDSIEHVINKYNVKRAVVDKGPERSKVKELVEKFPGRVYAAIYPTMDFSVQEYVIWDDIKHEVRLDRTISLDYLIGNIQNQNIEFPKNIQLVEGFYKQLRSSTRIHEKTRGGKEVSKWIEKGPDHFFHALNYARIAQLRGVVGEALLNYYGEPEDEKYPGGLGPNIVDWLRINSQRIHLDNKEHGNLG